MPRFEDPNDPDCFIECTVPNGFARYRRPIGPCVTGCGETSIATAIREMIEVEGADVRFSIDARMESDGLANLLSIVNGSPAASSQIRLALGGIEEGIRQFGQNAMARVRLTDTDAVEFLEAVADGITTQAPDTRASYSE